MASIYLPQLLVTRFFRSWYPASPSRPDGEVPQFTVISEERFTRQGFTGKDFKIETDATSGPEMRLVAEQMRHDNPELGLMDVKFFPSSGKEEKSIGSVFVSNSREAVDVRFSRGWLKDASEEDKDRHWEQRDGIIVFPDADFEREMNDSIDELQKDIQEDAPPMPDEMPMPDINIPDVPEPRMPNSP